MAVLPFIFVGVPITMYTCQAAFYFFHQGRVGLCITMLCYALANVGVLIDAFEVAVKTPK